MGVTMMALVASVGILPDASASTVLSLARDVETRTGRRLGAFMKLQQLKASAAPAIPSLLCLIEEEVTDTPVAHGGDMDLRLAAETLSAIGPAIIPPIMAVLDAPCGSQVGRRVDGRACRLALPDWQEDTRAEYCDWVRFRLAGALGDLDAAVVPELVSSFRKSGAHRPYVAVALGSARKSAETVIPPLVEGLHENEPKLVRACAFALGQIGPPARQAVPALRALLASPDEQIRVAAQQAIQSIDPEAK